MEEGKVEVKGAMLYTLLSKHKESKTKCLTLTLAYHLQVHWGDYAPISHTYTSYQPREKHQGESGE